VKRRLCNICGGYTPGGDNIAPLATPPTGRRASEHVTDDGMNWRVTPPPSEIMPPCRTLIKLLCEFYYIPFIRVCGVN